MAENGLTEPVIGVTFDGTGYGTDGAVWGGEFLVGDYRQFRRAAHLRYVGMPGGDQAIREPWRMAVAHLRDAGVANPYFVARLDTDRKCCDDRSDAGARLQCPLTSSAGRLFDAVAALVGRPRSRQLRRTGGDRAGVAGAPVSPDGSYPFDIGPTAKDASEPTLIRRYPAADPSRLPGRCCGRRPRPASPGDFTRRLVEIIAAVCGRIGEETGSSAVVLSGGVFLNPLLTP